MKHVIVIVFLSSPSALTIAGTSHPVTSRIPAVAAIPPSTRRRLNFTTECSGPCIACSISLAPQGRFVYRQSVKASAKSRLTVADIASAIGEPARARMLASLMDGRARTATELAAIAGVTPSTASVHLQRLSSAQLVKVLAQGKCRYYSLHGTDVAAALEGLSVLAGASHDPYIPRTPGPLRFARTCYDHLAGTTGVALHDRLTALQWIALDAKRGTNREDSYSLTPQGARAFTSLGIDVDATRNLRRRFAYACLDWSERRPHLGGALGAALLHLALKKRWVTQQLDSRILTLTSNGRREMYTRFGLTLDEPIRAAS
jgi:DNA-binding transcriptional ArsR family regulator